MTILKLRFSLFALFTLISFSSMAQLNKTTNQVTFFFFHVTDNKGEIQIDLKEKKNITGEFKVTPSAQEFEKEPGKLLITVTDNASGRTEYESVVVNPVDMHLEYVNEKNEYDQANVKLEEGDFDVRIPMSTDGKTITIQLIKEDKSLLTLKTIR